MPEEKKRRRKTVSIQDTIPVDSLPPEQKSAASPNTKKPKKSAFSYLFEEGDADPYDLVYEQHSGEEEQIGRNVDEGFGQAVQEGNGEGYQPAGEEEAPLISSPAQPQLPRDLSLFEEDEDEPPKEKRSLFSRLRKNKKQRPEKDTEEIFDLYHYEPVKTEIEEPGDQEKDLAEEELNFFHQLTGQFKLPEEHRPQEPEIQTQSEKTAEASGKKEPAVVEKNALEIPSVVDEKTEDIPEPYDAEKTEEVEGTEEQEEPKQDEESAKAPLPVFLTDSELPEREPSTPLSEKIEQEEQPDGPDLAPPLENFVHPRTEPFPEEKAPSQTISEEEPEQEVDISSMGSPQPDRQPHRRVEGAFLVAEETEPVLIYTPPHYKMPLDAALGGGVTEQLRIEYQQYSTVPTAEPQGHTVPLSQTKRKHLDVAEPAGGDADIADDAPEDYRSKEDAASVRHSISQLLKRLFLQCTVTVLLGIFLAALALFERLDVSLSGPFSITENPVQYLTVYVAALLLAMLVCFPTVFGGLKSLFTLHGDADTAVSWACVACLIQIFCGYAAPDSLRVEGYALFAPAAVLLLFLNTVGKFLIMKRTQKNFRFISSSEPKYAVQNLAESEVDPRLATEDNPAPMVAYTVKSGFLDNFLRLSYRYDEGETASQKISLYTSAGALLLGLISYLVAGNISASLAVFAASACFAVPAANMLVANVPIYRAVKRLLKKGVMLSGASALEEFGDSSFLMLDADELFPQNAVVLNVIKTFSQLRVDEAIVDAAALVCAMGGPMADMFNRIIQGRASILPKVDSFAFEEGMGAIGWVSGRRILVGNRELMLRHGIQPPSRDYEQKYTLGGRCTTYLAAGGDLVAMFVMSYSVDQEVGKALSELCRDGVKLLVRSKDVNVTAEMVEEGFGLPEGSVTLLTDELARTYDEKTEKTIPSADACLGVSGKLCATCRGISTCIRLKNSIALAVLVQLVGVFLGLALVLVLALSGGIAQLGVLELLCFGVFWLAVVLLIPFFRRS